MNAIIIGKGPTFNERAVLEDADLIISINEASLYVEGTHYAVASDPQVAKTLRLWSPVKGFQLVVPSHLGVLPGPTVIPMDTVDGATDWRSMTRREALDRQVLFTKGYSSTIALWLAWMMGCTHVTTYGIGGDGYHEYFEGEPGHPDQGQQAADILYELADYKRIDLDIL